VRRVISIAALALAMAGAGGGAALAAGDAAHGKAVFDQCTGCHVLSGQGFAAPPLGGVVGRKAGTAPGFQYSDAMTRSGIVWSEESLDKFLSDPSKLVPGTTMYVGLDNAKDRADVIAYLKTVAGAPSP
jgi:cytochrome c